MPEPALSPPTPRYPEARMRFLRRAGRALLFTVGGAVAIWLVGRGYGYLGASCRSSLLCNPQMSLLYGAVAGFWLSFQIKPWPRADGELAGIQPTRSVKGL